MIETRKREHSRKPDEQYELIEACPVLTWNSSRYPRPGRRWGDESDAEVTPRAACTRATAAEQRGRCATAPARVCSHAPSGPATSRGVASGDSFCTRRVAKAVVMGILDRFESSLDKMVNGAFAKAFKSDVQPVEIAAAVQKEMDERAAVVTRARTVVPNEYVVHLSESDFERLSTYADVLSGELAEQPGVRAGAALHLPGTSRGDPRG